MAIVDRVRELVAPVVAGASAELYDVEHHGGVVRVLVDVEGGVDLSVLQSISRQVSRLLDEADPIPGRYTLEVSSPGLERPLRTADHFRRAVGADVRVKTMPGVEGDRRVTGQLVAADDEGIEIRTDSGVRRVGLDQISRARTVFEWGPTPKPGASRPTDSPDPGRDDDPAGRQKEAPTS